MAEPCREKDDTNTVFVDTNLETHLAMIVSNSDSVSDLKKKIMLEHPLCFPKIGEIQIHALKVKRRGYFYHLSDSMLVKSSFEGVKKNWFLSADASSMKHESRYILPDDPSTSTSREVLLHQPANRTLCTEQKVPVTNDHSKNVPSDVKVQKNVGFSGGDNVESKQKDDKSKEVISGVQLNNPVKQYSKKVPSDGKVQKNVGSSEGTNVSDQKDDTSKKVISGVQSNNPVEPTLGTKPPAKRKRKTKNSEDIVKPVTLPEPSGSSLKEKHSDIAQDVVETTKVPSSSLGKPVAENMKGASNGPELVANGIKSSKKQRSTFNAPLVVKETDNLGQSMQTNTVADDNKSAKIVECNGANEANKKIDKMEEGPILSVHLTIAKEDMEKSTGSKRKKRRATKSSSRNHEESKDDDAFVSPEVPTEMPMNVLSAGAEKEGNTINGNEAELTLPQMKTSEGIAENVDEKSSKKKRRRSQISTAKAVHNPIKEQGVEVESVQVIQVEEIQDVGKTVNGLKPVGLASAVADRVGDNLNGNEAELVPLTQTKTIQGSAETIKEKPTKKARKSLISDPKSVTDNPIKEQGAEVEKFPVNQDEEKTNNKPKRKTKNPKSEAKSLQDLSIKEQKVGGEELNLSNGKLNGVIPPSKQTTKPKAVKAKANGSGLKPELITNVDSSQVSFPDVLEDALGDKSEADKHLTVSKCESDNINFKNYFMPGQPQNGSAFADKMKEAKISDTVIKPKKRAPITKKTQVKSSNNTQTQGSLLKDGNNGLMLPPQNKPSEVSNSGVKAPSISGIGQLKPPQVVEPADVVSASEKENTEPVSASSSESSGESLQNGSGSKHRPSLNPYLVAVTKSSAKNTKESIAVKKASVKNAGEVVNGSQQAKSLFTKPAAVSKDGSTGTSSDGDSSSNASTRTPTCDSSSSGLGGESDSTLDSPKTGSFGIKRKDDGTNAMKTPSAPKNMTMDMIFRNSSRFKKAKLTASQVLDSESQPIEFVPDSQGNP